MARISNMTIDGRVLSRLVIDGRAVSFAREPVTLDCLCFTAQEPNSTVKMVAQGSAPVVNLQISRDGRSWNPYVMGADILLQNVDDKVYWKAVGSNETIGGNGSGNKFVMTGRIAASGNVNSLLEENEETARTMGLKGRAYCYSELFYNCTSLTSAPELPATTMCFGCYTNMFSGCTSLVTAPVLPATTLDKYCYYFMFSGCTSLVKAPELPSTTLGVYCYQNMFQNCTSLEEAPELPAQNTVGWCYYEMFKGCTKLNHIKVGFTDFFRTDATTDWLPDNVGKFECKQELINNTTDRTTSTVPPKWIMKTYDAQPDCLCFTAEEPNSTVKLQANGTAPVVNLQTSTDGKSWTPYTIGDTITLANANDKVYFNAIGSNDRMGSSLQNYNYFSMTGKIAASGNVNSLLEEDENTSRTMSLVGKTYCYFKLFFNCKSLTAAPKLPSTTLANNCYQSMFQSCTSLVNAPELPATTLANNCYQQMFSGCKSLIQAPELPATTLANSCYQGMFPGCTSLVNAPELPATTLANSCYDSMFNRCTSLVNVPVLPATTLTIYCYSSMFDGCTSLVNAPKLPSTTLANYCYNRMFQNCTSLTSAPELSSTTLAINCYNRMFGGCTNLNKVKVSFTNWDPANATDNWLPDNTGTFECPQELIDNTTDRTPSTVPPSWTMTPTQY